MKKRDLIENCIVLLISVGCLITVLFFDTKLDGLLSAFAVVFLGRSIRKIWDYRYWSRPENRERYQEMQENERIENHDELKEKIRDQSGRYAYAFGQYVICFFIIFFEILRAVEVMDYNMTRALALSFGAFLIIQLIAEKVIFKHLMKKY